MGILHGAHLTTRLAMVASRFACLRMASAVRSRKVNGTQFLAIGLAKFLFALDPRRVIPPRDNALAPRRGGPRILDGPPPLTRLARVADVSAQFFVPDWPLEGRKCQLSLILMIESFQTLRTSNLLN